MVLNELSNAINHLTPERIALAVRVILLAFVGIPFIYLASAAARKYISRHYSAQQGMIFGKILQYGGLSVILLTIFYELGFSLAPLLGAAGIVGVAVGFASQTSVSNIISGVFLMAEKPFVVDDVILVGEITGYVMSIDMLSVKLRTFDNRFVRIPNETIIKSEVINVTRFPIRRLDLNIGVAYKEDVEKVKRVLLELASKNPLCLQEPEPQVIFTGFGDSSINFMLALWAERTDWLKLKNSIQAEIKARFDKEKIEIPFPHISVYAGSETQALPITVCNQDK